ncbi:MAG: flippase-like domain-containing protein [Gammaproteobacteria bacterium]|nr:flippase-like domain-containing protein [Gammaproteobacteria bacterium]MBV9723806.1 flippase-like domain-containing protein [Gammaproteobacteria bacterium]
MRRHTVIALIVGAAAVAATVFYAGTGAVLRAVASLRLSGLLLLALVHVPMVALMGCAWRLASGRDPPASPSRFVWARFVRDAAGELLPFLQLGGVLFGVRALGRGRAITVGAVSAGIDGVVELAAKVPYALAALAALLVLAPHSRLTRPLSVALAATAIFVGILLFARRSLTASLEAMARAISARWPEVFSLADGPLDTQIRLSFERILRERGYLWGGFALHLLCWFLAAGEVWITFRLLGIDLTLAEALAIDGTVAGLRTFSWMVPAAAGVQEVSYLLAAAVFGIPAAAGIAASFARRARDVLLGFATLLVAILGDSNVGPAAIAALRSRQPPRAG